MPRINDSASNLPIDSKTDINATQFVSRTVPSTERQRERATEAQNQSASAVAALAKAGVSGINAQVFAFDSALDRFEDQTADQLVERLRQSPIRIQQKVAARMAEIAPVRNELNDIFAEVLEVADIASLPSADEAKMLGAGGF